MNLANVTQGPAGNAGRELRRQLASRGQAHGLQYAEYFHYIGPDETDIGDYVEKNAVPL